MDYRVCYVQYAVGAAEWKSCQKYIYNSAIPIFDTLDLGIIAGREECSELLLYTFSTGIQRIVIGDHLLADRY